MLKDKYAKVIGIIITLTISIGLFVPSITQAEEKTSEVGISFKGTTPISDDTGRNPGVTKPIIKTESRLPQTSELLPSFVLIVLGCLLIILSLLILINFRREEEV